MATSRQTRIERDFFRMFDAAMQVIEDKRKQSNEKPRESPANMQQSEKVDRK